MFNDIKWIVKKNKRIFVLSIVYSLFVTSIILYIASLKGCFLSIKQCSGYEKIKTYFRLGIYLIASSMIFGVLICIQILSRIGCADNIFFFLILFIIFFFTQGTDFAHHGTYNSIIFILFFPIFSLISFVIYLTLYFCCKIEIKKLLILLLYFLYVIIFVNLNTKCNQFYNGIGGIKLINDKKLNKCFIKKPRICGQNFLSGLFDLNYFRKKGCKGYNSHKKIFLKYLDKKLEKYNNFSYPRTENWNPRKSYSKKLANLVEKKISPANENNSKIKEVFVSFNGSKGEVKINLKKNISLVKYKRNLSKKYNVKFNNIYMIYFDALSRNSFIRKLKKSTKLIEKILFTNKRKEERLKIYNAFQFFKYHNFNGHTEGNIFPLFYGNQRNSNKGISFVKFLNERGFITAAAHNSCNREIFDWNGKNKNVVFSNFDHENIGMFCDANFEDKNDKWSIIRGKSSIFRKCLYGRDSFDYNFEYILQFLESYKDERKFFRITIADGHEGTTEVIKFVDQSFSTFLLKILKNYFDDKTAIIIFSDHGPHMPGPYDVLFYEEKIFEKYLGLLLLIIPNKNEYNLSNILFNQQQFITVYDIHDTLLDMINVSKYEYIKLEWNKGQSLFNKINGTQRNCQYYSNEITQNFCFCENYMPEPT